MQTKTHYSTGVGRRWPAGMAAALGLLFFGRGEAHASFLHGDTLDAVANGISWAALVIAPIVLITAFLAVHVLPEKIAHKKKHPQTPAIRCLCLLSLVFGGLLWPLAWLWAYSKPIGYKLAYGTDKVDEHAENAEIPRLRDGEIEKLRGRVAELEAKLTEMEAG